MDNFRIRPDELKLSKGIRTVLFILKDHSERVAEKVVAYKDYNSNFRKQEFLNELADFDNLIELLEYFEPELFVASQISWETFPAFLERTLNSFKLGADFLQPINFEVLTTDMRTDRQRKYFLLILTEALR